VRLGQVVTNLCDNAIKFTDAGSVGLRVSVAGGPEAPLKAPDQIRVRFEVTDSGIGIDASARGSLLDPFTQADASTTRRFGGTGLGLAISRQLVDLMGGTFDFRSRVGEGSTFWFEVALPSVVAPLVSSDTTPEAGPDGSARAPASPDHRPRVLVVEDSKVNQLVTLGLLEQLGYDVDLAINGLEAVEAAASGRYDAILMDCLMPVMDGYEATARIRALPGAAHSTPIVALTASAMSDDRTRCLEAGMDDYVSKPLDPPALAAALARCRATRPRLTPIGPPATPASLAHGGAPGSDAVLDRAVLGRLQELGESFFRELIGLFLDDVPRRLVGIVEALEAGDATGAGRFAHSVKGSAANLGAGRLADLCAELEAMGDAGTLPGASGLFNGIQAEYRRVADALNAELHP
jgi:CheY-like chemotaxis protein/HPt (histidine-containing phosphotransfer) domain-containing protein